MRTVFLSFTIVIKIQVISCCEDEECVQLPKYKYCKSEPSVSFECTIPNKGARAAEWIHSNKGTVIRVLQGRVVNYTNVLTIPFCNSQDIGQYTCVWETTRSNISKTTTLVVKGR